MATILLRAQTSAVTTTESTEAMRGTELMARRSSLLLQRYRDDKRLTTTAFLLDYAQRAVCAVGALYSVLCGREA